MLTTSLGNMLSKIRDAFRIVLLSIGPSKVIVEEAARWLAVTCL